MQTIVIIGASNVTLSLPVIWSTLRRSLNEPFRLIVTAGHGRSFGLPSTVVGRTLPSILECGLWEQLDRLDDSSPIHAVVTDVGNDLLYGAESAEISGWVNDAVNRLRIRTPNILLTGLPIDSLQSLSARRFEFFRRLMFPQSTLTFENALAQGNALHHQLLNADDDGTISTITPESRWYGFDPIHIRRRCRRAAWERYLSLCLPTAQLRRCGPMADLSVWKGTAERRWKHSQLLTSQQPTRTSNQNELWLF